MKGKGTNPAAELQLAQSLSRAATAIRRAETAVETYGNGSEGAEAAYGEAAEAVTQFLEADAALHHPSGASSSSAAPASSSSAAVGKGAANLGLSAYRDFVANKGKGMGKMCRAQPDAAAENEERSDCEEDLENENYEEEVEEEEEEHGDDEDYVEVELEVIPEEEHGDHGDGHDTEGHEDDAHGLENNEEENHGHEEGEPNYDEEEEFVHEEHT